MWTFRGQDKAPPQRIKEDIGIMKRLNDMIDTNAVSAREKLFGTTIDLNMLSRVTFLMFMRDFIFQELNALLWH